MDKYSDALAEEGFEYNVAYGIWIMPVVKNREHFKYWVQAYPFYGNVQREGGCFMKQPDSVDVGTRMDVAMHRIQVAKEDLDTAYLTFNAKQFRGANNRAYYCIHHTISAVLAKEGVAFKRHKDTLGYFDKKYINTEIFSKELGRKIVKAEEICYASDYDAFYIALKDVAEQQIKTAETLLKLVSEYLEIEKE